MYKCLNIYWTYQLHWRYWSQIRNLFIFPEHFKKILLLFDVDSFKFFSKWTFVLIDRGGWNHPCHPSNYTPDSSMYIDQLINVSLTNKNNCYFDYTWLRLHNRLVGQLRDFLPCHACWRVWQNLAKVSIPCE